MNWFGELIRRVLFRLRGAQFERDMQEEMRLHVDLRSADRPDARQAFGNVTLLTETSREAWGWTWLDRLGQDLRYGVRTLAANPGFTATAVLSLALGIGANTAIFSIINALMLRSLPVPDPQTLVQIEESGNPGLTNPLWEQIRDHQPGFAGALAFDSDRFDLSDGGESRFAEGLYVSGSYFQVLGVPAAMGRTFTTEDDRHGGGTAGPVAVISYSFWQRNFNGDPQVIGKTVRLNRQTFEVIGVTPSWFTGLNADKSFDVAIPIGCVAIVRPGSDTLTARDEWWLHIWGRLAPGQSKALAEERLAAITPAILRATLSSRLDDSMQNRYLSKAFQLRPIGQGISITGRQYRTALFTLMAIVGLVLLIACANIANLLLARASARRREFSIRMAIGAGRGRIVRQLLTESLLLALLGTAGGFLLAQWGGRLLIRLLSTAGNPVTVDLAPDLRSLAFTGGVAILTALLFGLVPALRATRVHARDALAAAARGARQEAGRPRLGKALVAVQIALSLVLLVGAALFLGTLHNLLTLDLGFSRTHILLVGSEMQHAAIPKADQARAHHEIVARLSALPGVVSAAASYLSPLGRTGWNGMSYPEGFVPQSRRDGMVFLNRVSPGYFRTMRSRLLVGRDFEERDTVNAPKVMMINESTAKRFFGSAYPIGKTIGMDRPGRRGERDAYEVIGVVKDAKYNRVDEDNRKIAYLAIGQDPDPGPRRNYEVLTSGPVEAVIPAIRAAVADVNRDTTLVFRSLETQVNETLLQPRMVALLSAVFGSLALVLAMVGLYGITAYGVARRKGEIGIRMALGAQRESVVRMMMKEVLVLLAIGTTIGVAAALAGGRLIKTLLFGLQPNDPAHLAGAAVVLAVAALVAAYLPARRAARIDPMAALRDE
jgi:putative ABC transport system permease protein